MVKVMECSSTGMDCGFVARGENEDQVMAQVADHARNEHGMQTIPSEVVEKVKAAIHEE
jgi:predicted small metal-binding protein